MAAFMAMPGRAKGSMLDLRLAGIGIPALAHMAAALALAISNNCSLSEEPQERKTLKKENTELTSNAGVTTFSNRGH